MAEVVVVLVVAAGAAWESSVLDLIGSRPGMVVLKRCVDVDELLAASAAHQADAAVVALDAPGLDPTAAEVLRGHQVRLVAVGPTDERARTRASRLTVDALVDHDDLERLLGVLDGSDHGLRAVTRAAQDLDDPLPDAGPGGRVLAVWGPAGAPGRTTVAVGLGSLLARRGLATCVVDADPYGGTVAQHLGILDEASGLLGAARLAADGVLASRLASVQRALGDRLTVVTGLPRGDRWAEVRPGALELLLDLARRRGHVVVDTGFGLEDDPAELAGRPGRDHLTLGALEAADEVVVVGAPDPVGLARLARGLVDLRERRADVPLRVVLNRMRPSLRWSEREVIALVRGFARVEAVHVLPDDRGAADRALAEGTSAADAGDSPLRSALADLADALAPPVAAHRRRHRRTARAAALVRRPGAARRRQEPH